MSVPDRNPDTARLPDEHRIRQGQAQHQQRRILERRVRIQLRFYARDNLQIELRPQIDKPEGI